jgi:hypothetical protein
LIPVLLFYHYWLNNANSFIPSVAVLNASFRPAYGSATICICQAFRYDLPMRGLGTENPQRFFHGTDRNTLLHAHRLAEYLQHLLVMHGFINPLGVGFEDGLLCKSGKR